MLKSLLKIHKSLKGLYNKILTRINTLSQQGHKIFSTYFSALIMQELSRNNQRINKKNNRKWFGIFTRNFGTTVV
jgi:hypothetical protein